jgi:hypothetical protein
MSSRDHNSVDLFRSLYKKELQAWMENVGVPPDPLPYDGRGIPNLDGTGIFHLLYRKELQAERKNVEVPPPDHLPILRYPSFK